MIPKKTLVKFYITLLIIVAVILLICSFYATLYFAHKEGIQLGILGWIILVLSFILIHIKRNLFQGKIKKFITALKIFMLVIIFFSGAFLSLLMYGLCQRCTRSKVSRAKAEMQSIATALEDYYIDNNVYPKPDFDEERKPVIPKALTTPVAYITSLFRDPFKNNGKGLYEYGGGEGIWPGAGWIVTSYGPDTVDGNSGIPEGSMLIERLAWSDEVFGKDPRLENSEFTYDPTNGELSPGDIWRRGP